MKHCVWLWEHSYGLTLPNAWSLVKEMHWITSYGLHFLLLLFYEVFEDKLFQNFSPTLQETVQSISIYSWLKHRKPLDASWLWGMFFATQNVHNNVSTVTGKARIVSSLLICATFANGIKRCTIVSVRSFYTQTRRAPDWALRAPACKFHICTAHAYEE